MFSMEGKCNRRKLTHRERKEKENARACWLPILGPFKVFWPTQRVPSDCTVRLLCLRDTQISSPIHCSLRELLKDFASNVFSPQRGHVTGEAEFNILIHLMGLLFCVSHQRHFCVYPSMLLWSWLIRVCPEATSFPKCRQTAWRLRSAPWAVSHRVEVTGLPSRLLLLGHDPVLALCFSGYFICSTKCPGFLNLDIQFWILVRWCNWWSS